MGPVFSNLLVEDVLSRRPAALARLAPLSTEEQIVDPRQSYLHAHVRPFHDIEGLDMSEIQPGVLGNAGDANLTILKIAEGKTISGEARQGGRLRTFVAYRS